MYLVSYSPASAVCHYRLRLPAEALLQAGIECEVGGAVMVGSDGSVSGLLLPDLKMFRHPDVIVLQPRQGVDWTVQIEAARRAGQAVVMDLDDWWWDLPPGFPEVTTRDIQEWLPALERMIASSSLVTASTPFIAEQVSSIPGCPPTKVLRNMIDLERWGAPETVDDGPTLGYAGALLNHAEDVAWMRPWLGRYVEERDLRIVHFGEHYTLPRFAEVAGVDPSRVEERPGIAWDEYAGSRPFHGVDIGLVPLVPRPFNAAKSALKGMEYSACGVPFVCSPAPEYQRLGCGVVAGPSLEEQTPEAWIEALDRLLDPSVRRQLGHAARSSMETQSVAARGSEWVATYQDLMR